MRRGRGSVRGPVQLGGARRERRSISSVNASWRRAFIVQSPTLRRSTTPTASRIERWWDTRDGDRPSASPTSPDGSARPVVESSTTIRNRFSSESAASTRSRSRVRGARTVPSTNPSGNGILPIAERSRRHTRPSGPGSVDPPRRSRRPRAAGGEHEDRRHSARRRSRRPSPPGGVGISSAGGRGVGAAPDRRGGGAGPRAARLFRGEVRHGSGEPDSTRKAAEMVLKRWLPALALSVFGLTACDGDDTPEGILFFDPLPEQLVGLWTGIEEITTRGDRVL